MTEGNQMTHFDPAKWDGDPDKLPSAEDPSWDEDLCELTFLSKLEAFTTGFAQGARLRDVPDKPIRINADMNR
jgi:hypothetical protein